MSIVRSIIEGVIVALLPGGHPLLLGERPFFETGIIYGFYTAFSLWMAERGLVKPETAGGRPMDPLRALGVLLRALLLLPLALLLYKVSLPSWLILALLLVGSLHLLSLPFLLSGIMGLVAFRWSTVADPLGSGFLYMFGLGRWDERGTEKNDRGVLAAFMTGLVPGLPPSAWAKLLGGGGVSSAAVVGPLFALVAFYYGKTRSAMTALLQSQDVYVIGLTAMAYVLSLLAGLSLASHITLRLPPWIRYILLLLHAALHGPSNMLLLLAAHTLVKITKDPSHLFGFIIVPTMAYYTGLLP